MPLPQLNERVKQLLLKKLQRDQAEAQRDQGVAGMQRVADVEGQRDLDEMARYGNLASGLSQASAKIGGTAPARNIDRDAIRLQKSADAGRKALESDDDTLGFDPKLFSYLTAIEKNKNKIRIKPKPMKTTDKMGRDILVQTDESGFPVKGGRSEVVKDINIPEQTEKLRERYNKEAKAIQLIGNSFDKINRLAESAREANLRDGGSGPYDYQIIKAFEKLQDPTSVVREAEFAMVAALGSMLDKIATQFQGHKRGDKLSEPVRKSIVDSIKIAYQTSLDADKRIRHKYSKMANRMGIPLSEVFTELPQIDAEKTGFPRDVSKIEGNEKITATVINEAELKEAQSLGFK